MPLRDPRGQKHHWKPKMGAKAYPLCKIVGGSYGDPLLGEFKTLWYETLECGHRQTPKTDFIGETNAVARRCRKCHRQQEGGDP